MIPKSWEEKMQYIMNPEVSTEFFSGESQVVLSHRYNSKLSGVILLLVPLSKLVVVSPLWYICLAISLKANESMYGFHLLEYD